ncbi:hypothetical protein MNBD_DELTA02-151 [hydrothermal vent metagenome]|uniref:Uncharacterized protein n=1 Tax=hydrothermal vent metagenome TaxID=652676 RepID=A0A3B0W3H5_9ZZZZ
MLHGRWVHNISMVRLAGFGERVFTQALNEVREAVTGCRHFAFRLRRVIAPGSGLLHFNL